MDKAIACYAEAGPGPGVISWLRVAKFPFCCVQENKENGKVIHPEMLVFFTLSFCFGTEN